MWGRLLLLFVAIANKILLSILGVLLKSYRPLCALVSYTINESNSTSLNIKVRVIVKVRIRGNFWRACQEILQLLQTLQVLCSRCQNRFRSVQKPGEGIQHTIHLVD